MDTIIIVLYISDVDIFCDSDVCINTAGIHQCTEDWSWDTARAPFSDIDLWMVLDGSAFFDTPQRSFILCPGDCFFLRPGAMYRGLPDPQAPPFVIAIHFDRLDKNQKVMPPNEKWLPRLYRRLHQLAFPQELMTRAVHAYTEGQLPAANTWLKTVLIEIQSQEHLHATREPATRHVTTIEEITREIRQRPAYPYRVGELAQRCGLCADRFTKVFQKIKGVSPSQFIIRSRIEAARSLLLCSNYSITKIAQLTGYEDVFFFSKQFHAKTGLSPTAFRGFSNEHGG